AGEMVSVEGDTCLELLLLLHGNAESKMHQEDGSSFTRHLIPGQILDELEVLCHGPQTGTIVAETAQTRILSIPVDALDELADRDTDFARRLLDLESQRLQQLLYRNQ
ncbi:MAG: cyclic nucleotide-binding domain-containing protein, partial [Leptolyngbyaceae cyanobacterium bins.59]|nr:cyclic nucleotide-binding domain-containing protein [Leptolyngbyaceae cyanobacterium bins.59]